jgi:flagellar hook protein FlgE
MANMLLTGLSGLDASQQMLDVVGNNLANSNTTGFKAQTVQFSDLLYQTEQAATGGNSTTSGGINPTQIGQGVQVATIASNLQQGALQTTGNQFDVGLQGNGYFVVNNDGQNFYTRAGSFGVNAQNYLVDPATGALVQRFGTVGEGSSSSPAFQTSGNDGIQIPNLTEIPGPATTTIALQGNLDASTAGPQAEVLTSAQPFLTGGVAATASTLLNSLDDNTIQYVAGDKIQIQGTTASGTAVNTTLSVGPATTLGNLVSALNTDFPGSTASVDANGNLVLKANNTGPSQLALTLSDVSGDTGSTNWSAHAMGITTVGQDGGTAAVGAQIYDAQGNAYTLTLTFQKQANNTWNMTGSLPPGDGTVLSSTVTGITFNANGSLQMAGASSGLAMTIEFPDQAVPQTVDFSLGSTNGFNGLTQVGGASSVAVASQNGYAAGSLSSITIDQTGLISGVFSNGQTLAVAQMAIANFANPQGLSRDGNNYFSETSQSGPASVGAGLSNGAGSVSQSTLESSNVDVNLEFTNLIVAQQAYQVNARVITVGDQVLQELVNIIR